MAIPFIWSKYHKACFLNNLLIFNHSTNVDNSVFIETVILFRLSSSIKTLVPFANNIGKILSDTLTISLTYNRNRSGPKIDPWGTPHKTVLAAETLSLKETNCINNYLSMYFQQP